MRYVQTPASRNTDPETSHQAERAINASGERKRQQELVVDLVRRYPNSTCQELAQHGVLNDRQLSRRLSECETAGAIERSNARRCTVSGVKAATWHPREPQRVLPL